jgi:succinate dehydrogenase / fumarate reductase cytochrome b subunit
MLLRYRGREGMLAWAFHRISGVAIFLFVVLHVVDIYLVGGDPGAYDTILQVYASLPGRIMEILLGAALLYHALNGLRILIIDLWPAMTVHHRFLWYASWVIFVAVGIPAAYIILKPVIDPALEPAGVISRFQGLRVMPQSGLSVTALYPNSQVAVFPRRMAPAALSLSTTTSS